MPSGNASVETHGDLAWSTLQARVYGPELDRAVPFPGAFDCIRSLLHRGHEVAIVSHKTRVAAGGPIVRSPPVRVAVADAQRAAR